MELFYHVSRDIEMPRGRRPVRVQPGPRACEACGAELEQGARSEGGTYGLAFCADCRDRFDRSAVQIHFCDTCGGSVPHYAAEGGVALVGDGRILCATCRTPPARGVPPLGPALAVLVALALGTALAWVVRI